MKAIVATYPVAKRRRHMPRTTLRTLVKKTIEAHLEELLAGEVVIRIVCKKHRLDDTIFSRAYEYAKSVGLMFGRPVGTRPGVYGIRKL